MPKKAATTDKVVEAAAKKSLTVDLVHISECFARVGLNGPYTCVLPLQTSAWITEKTAYRKVSVLAGASFNVDSIKIGRRNGLIFLLALKGDMKCPHGTVEWIELSWDDIVNSFPDLYDQFTERLEAIDDRTVDVPKVDDQLREVIGKNKGMHDVLSKGFARAQEKYREEAKREEAEGQPGWGMFGLLPTFSH